MKTESFTLATAAASWMQDGLWTALYYEEGAAGGVLPTIRVRSLTGAGKVDAVLKPGRQITLREPAQGIVITSACGQPVTGKVTMGAGDIRDSSVIGEVSVIDGGKSRTITGSAFSGLAYEGGATGNYPHAELYCLSAGKRLVVSQVMVTATLKDLFVSLRLASGIFVGNTLQPYAQKNTVLTGTAVGAARLYAGHNTTSYTGTAPIGSLAIKSFSTAVYKFTEPLVLPTGAGLVAVGVGSSGFENDLGATFEWFEEDA